MPPHIPKQNLINRIHIICISQDRSKAQKISQELKTEMIDFSAFELPVTNLGELSRDDVAWLRTVFLPHGLAESTQPVRKERRQRSSDGVEEFLLDWCTVCEGNLCDRASVYAAYCACYCHTHPGLQPPLTMGRFVKQVKKRIGRGALSKVTYRKVRAQQRMFFDGLVCPSELPPPVSVPSPSVRDSFSDYLLAINEDAPGMFLSKGLPEPR